MAQERRVRFRFRKAARRWGLPRRWALPRRHIHFGRRSADPGFAPESSVTLANVHEAAPAVRRLSTWPVLAASGSLEVRIAQTEQEIAAAQRLRYRVFYEEMSAKPTLRMRAKRRDFDRYDAFCDHLLTIDRNMRDEWGAPAVVGCYRLLRGEVAALHGGYYSASEYDLTPMARDHPPGTRFLELGRSCVLKSYRARASTMQLLWKGIVLYLDRYSINVMFGCASFPGIDPQAFRLPLSYLHHFHRTPEGERLRARPERYVEMNRMAKADIDPKEALRALPPLIKGYVRAGAYIGDGAVIDRQFGTTDVLIYFPVSHLGDRWRTKLSRAEA